MACVKLSLLLIEHLRRLANVLVRQSLWFVENPLVIGWFVDERMLTASNHFTDAAQELKGQRKDRPILRQFSERSEEPQATVFVCCPNDFKYVDGRRPKQKVSGAAAGHHAIADACILEAPQGVRVEH